MTTIELYVNGRLLDLSDASVIAQTFQANNLAELQNRQGDFTNQFKVPKTKNNREAMENAHIINSSTNIPYSRLTARLVQDGVETVREGIATLVGSLGRFYTLQVNSGNTSFFSLFPDKKVSELIGTSLDHVNDFDTVVGSRYNTTGYVYPLINWYNDSNNTAYMDSSVPVPFLLPCIFIKDLFDLVDAFTGFDSSGSFKDLPEFDNLILTPNALKRSESAQNENNATAKNTATQTFLIGADNGQSAAVAYAPTLDDFNGGFTGNAFTGTSGLYGYFVYSGSVTLKYKKYAAISRTVEVAVQLLKNGSTVVLNEIAFIQAIPTDPLEPEITTNVPFSLVSNNILLDPADTYSVRFVVSDANKSEVTVNLETEFLFALNTEVVYSGFMPVGELFDSITVKQVYQDVLNMYAVVPQSDSFKGKVTFNLFEDLTANMPKAKNWSSKIQVTDDHNLGYKFGKYGKVNNMKYQPTETVTLGFGDSTFAVADETLPDTVDAIQLSTSATEQEVRFQGVAYPRIKSVEDISRAFTGTNNRILLLDRKDVSYTHVFTDGTDSLETGDGIPYVTFEPLKFDVLKETYYQTLLGMLYKTKAPGYLMKLTRQDVQELDYLIPIYLDVHSGEIDVTGYFYLNKVANYINGFAKCELVRL